MNEVHAARGETGHALEWLGRAYTRRHRGLSQMKTRPLLAVRIAMPPCPRGRLRNDGSCTSGIKHKSLGPLLAESAEWRAGTKRLVSRLHTFVAPHAITTERWSMRWMKPFEKPPGRYQKPVCASAPTNSSKGSMLRTIPQETSMPYQSISDLPQAQTDQYSTHQKEVFLKAFNNALKEYGGDESRAFAVAHAAAKKATPESAA
jgi:cation transport regulator